MVWFFKIITLFGGIFAVIGVGLLVLFLLGLRQGSRFGFIVGGACGIGWILKEIFKCPRPDSAKALVYVTGYSFPSLHTVTAVVLALYIFAEFIQWGKLKLPLKIGAACCLAIGAALVGWSRVYLGVHFWKDVFAGAILGVMLYFMLTLLFDKVLKEKLSRKCKNLKDTKRLAHAFSKYLRNRKQAVVLFYAPMGAGKTTLIREIVKRLGAAIPATSPTFSIINKYNENVFHVDLYRIENALELLNTDFYEIIANDNFVFIEWAEKFDIDYPQNAIRVKINVMEGGGRVFDFTC